MMNPWLVLGGFITVLDAWLMGSGRASLSEHFRSASRSHPILVSGGSAYLLAHLYGILPDRADAVRGVARAMVDLERLSNSRLRRT